jgi:D-3-phosphoglycerate dehydrogenase
MRILLSESESYNADALAILSSIGDLECAELHDRSSLMSAVREVDVLVVRLRHRIDAELIAAAPRLRVIVSPTTGLDHIDLDAAASRQIAVLSLKDEKAFLDGITATAELTWALILELARRVGSAHREVLRGRWNRDAWRGNGLKGRVLGLLGYGRLGRIVGEYGRAFRMHVIANDPNVTDYADHVRAVTLDELLTDADVLSVHAHLDGTTVGLVGARQIDRMKRGAWLINTARGKIVDETALLDALQSGRLGAAALDVLSGETSGQRGWLEANPLLVYARAHDNLILTPHIGGATVDAMAETEIFMARKLRAYVHATEATQPYDLSKQVSA